MNAQGYRTLMWFIVAHANDKGVGIAIPYADDRGHLTWDIIYVETIGM